MNRALLVTALGCAAIAAGIGLWAHRMPSAPQTDFDILGVLWLLQNLPKLFLFALASLFGIGALYFLAQARKLRHGRLADEGERLLADPRFHGLLASQARRASNRPAQEGAAEQGTDVDEVSAP